MDYWHNGLHQLVSIPTYVTLIRITGTGKASDLQNAYYAVFCKWNIFINANSVLCISITFYASLAPLQTEYKGSVWTLLSEICTTNNLNTQYGVLFLLAAVTNMRNTWKLLKSSLHQLTEKNLGIFCYIKSTSLPGLNFIIKFKNRDLLKWNWIWQWKMEIL